MAWGMTADKTATTGETENSARDRELGARRDLPLTLYTSVGAQGGWDFVSLSSFRFPRFHWVWWVGQCNRWPCPVLLRRRVAGGASSQPEDAFFGSN